MPWVIKKSGSTFCLHKEGADGKASGEALKCHKTHAEALTHMRGLYANVDKGKSFDIFGEDESLKAKMKKGDDEIDSSWMKDLQELCGG